MASVKTIYSNSYKAKLARLKRLPKKVDAAIRGSIKRDLAEMQKIFHDGIAFNQFRLEALADLSIKGKKSKGYSKPKTPLYGAGDDQGNRSYANMLNLTKTRNGWKLHPSTRKHHSGKITLRKLFQIHEFGAIIKKKDKNGETKLILIPPRPAFLLAYRKWLTKRKRQGKETAKEVLSAIQEAISGATDNKLKILDSFNNRIFEEI